MHKNKIRQLSFLALLTALEIVLSRFCSINTWNLKIGFGFLPVALAATLFGPSGGAVVGGLSDFLGALLFPVGPYFPGFTLTAALSGFVFGLFLRRAQDMRHIIPAVLIHQMVLGFLLNSVWISVLYHSPFLPLLATRTVQCAVLVPVEIFVIAAAGRLLARYGRGYLYE